MFRPMIVAPAPPRMSSAKGVLALTSPPSSPWLSRNAFERDQPLVELLAADPERMLRRLVRPAT
jgi:hypothetical protein